MNILYLTTHLNIGGITSYVLSLAKGLKKRGHNVFIASSGGELLAKFTESGIRHIRIAIKTKQEFNPLVFISLLKLLYFVKKDKIDIIHSNTRVTQVLGTLTGHYARKPHISTCHGFFKKRFFRKVFPCWGRKVIAISHSVKEHLVDDFDVSEEDIRVIYHGIDLDKFKTKNPKSKMEIKKSLGLGQGPVVGIIARLSDVKGHTYLIEAMKEVLKNIPDAQLLIVGEGKMKENLAALVKKLGIEKSVFFLSNAYNMPDVLSAMDLFVMPSLKEGLGLSLMEAMAFGLPVIGSDVGGIKTLIRDGQNGLLVKPADSRHLAFRISELLLDPEEAWHLAQVAKAFINKNFSQDKMALETEGVYSECLSVKD